MNRAYRFVFLFALGGFVFFGTIVPGCADELSWPAITSQTKPWVWWWWPGSAVDTTNIARQLKLFQQAGLGGVQIIPIYGAKGYESNYIDFLSPEWMRMMGFTITEANQLGLGVDMALETGWCFGGPTTSNDDANALVVEKTIDVTEGEKLKGTFPRKTTQALMAFGPGDRAVDLKGKINADGHVDWTAPPGQWRVYAISQNFSGQYVKRAAPGGRGPMLNPFYPPAVKHYLQRFDQAFDAYSGPKPHAVFQDSYEYRNDWSPDFFAQFKKRRGYKLQAVLPALFGDAPADEAARVKYDYRRTVSDILSEQSEPIWINWAHQHGFQSIYQAHGTPGNWLDLYADADIPETEMFHNDRNILISKFASSAAHVAGHPLTGAETGTWLAEHFTETLAQLKYLADDMFLSGVNHIYYHGCCYSPETAPWPGWVFYASTEMNPRNSIWHDVPALNAYLARCQSVLQSGRPDNDVLLYWPVADFWSNPAGRLQPMTVSQTDWFENQPIGQTAHELWNSGYAFDYISDRQLQTAKVVDGKIQMPGGDYRVIVVPPCEYMPLATLKQLLALVQNGAKVVMNRLPEEVPGLADLESERAEFKVLLGKVGEPLATDHFGGEAHYGKGIIYRYSADPTDAGVMPELMTRDGLSFVRRSFDGGWSYFIANRSRTSFDGWITLARRAKSTAILDPMTGAAGVAVARQSAANVMEVHLQLAVGQSVILRAFANKNVEAQPWTCWRTNGQPEEIAGDWSVKFIQGGPTLPADYQTTQLASWTTFPDTNCEAFAGTADYSLTFDVPRSESRLQAARVNAELPKYLLDLGEVCQSARVKVNGKDYGTLIIPPFCVVVDNLKPTGNRLEIEVTNVSANRIRDLDRRNVPWKYFNDINFVDINYRPFDASKWPLTDSGLLGPVTLTPVTSH